MTVKLANNVSGFLNTAITASDTGIVLQSGNGASFPSLGAGEYFYATLVSTGNTLEVVKVTARSGDSMTVVRAQDGTSAASFAAGSRLEMRVNAAAVRDAIGDVVASQVGFTPVGGIAATDVQAALAEVDSEKIAFTRLDDNDGSSLVGYLPAGTRRSPHHRAGQAAGDGERQGLWGLLVSVFLRRITLLLLATSSKPALLGRCTLKINKKELCSPLTRGLHREMVFMSSKTQQQMHSAMGLLQ
jgi:hypothetical protein